MVGFNYAMKSFRHEDLVLLAAHAPPVPDWFNPDMPGPPDNPLDGLDPAPDRVAWRWLHNWIEQDGPRRSMRLDSEMVVLAAREADLDRARSAWCVYASEKWIQYEESRAIWASDREVEATVQWPFHYARLVLEAGLGASDALAGVGG